MIELIGKKVFHKKWGEGIIKEVQERSIKVYFKEGEKILAYPAAFKIGALYTEDVDMAEKVNADIEAEKERERKAKEEREKSRAERESREKEEKFKQQKPTVIRQNIAFKCNFCNGGANDEQVGFCGICSDDNIKNNIENRKYTECCQTRNICFQYYQGKIDRQTLDQQVACYESAMLKNWKASAGVSTDGKPETIRNAQINSLCVLTTRDPDDIDESQRYIFGAFIIDDIFEGDDFHEGYVRASDKSPYKIKLTSEEAHKLLFWDFYRNKNNPENCRWGQGLFRYLTLQSNPKKSDDDIAVAILKKIVELKQGKKDEQQAKEFLEYFCEINKIMM